MIPMDTIEAIRHRRSIRAYRPDAVPSDIVNEVIAAGFLAPSAHGESPWHVIVVTDAGKRHRLAATHQWSRFVEQSPVVIAVCVDRNTSDTFWIEDGAAFMENLMLAACARGLGTCWIGIRGAVYEEVDSEETVRDVLNVPEHMGILAITPLGYPAEDKPPHDLKVPSGHVHRDRFGG